MYLPFFFFFLCSSSSSFYLYFLSLFLPSFTVLAYGLLYCLSWHDLPFLPFNCFWLVVGVLPRLPTSLHAAQPLPLHYVSYTTPYSQTKIVLSCLLPFFVFNTLIRIRVKPLPHLPLWHAFSDFSSCLLLLGEMSSQQNISPQISLSKNPKIGSPFSPQPDHTVSYPWLVAFLHCIGWAHVGDAWALCACSTSV